MIPCMERYGTKSKNSKFNIRTSVFSFFKLCLQFGTESDNFECFCFLFPQFCSCILVLFSALRPNGGHVLVVGPVMWDLSSLTCGVPPKVQYKDFGFQLLQTMFAVWNRVRHFRMWFPFSLRPCSSGFFSVILDLILEVLPVVLELILMFSIFSDIITVVSFVFHMIQSDFMPTIIKFHTIPCMEPYDSMRFHAWKWREIIVWNHMVPCMESHGRLMNLDPGWNWLSG